jgi:hypothetical protein
MHARMTNVFRHAGVLRLPQICKPVQTLCVLNNKIAGCKKMHPANDGGWRIKAMQSVTIIANYDLAIC